MKAKIPPKKKRKEESSGDLCEYKKLKKAVVVDDVEMVRLLLGRGVPVCRTVGRYHDKMLFHAIKPQYNQEIVHLLLQHKAQVNSCHFNQTKETCIRKCWVLAVTTGRTDLLELFLKDGWNPNGVVRRRTPQVKEDFSYLYESIQYPKILKLLVDYKADVNIKRMFYDRIEKHKTFETALHKAIQLHLYDSCFILLLHGADPNHLQTLSHPPTQKTPLDLARLHYPSLIPLLVSFGATTIPEVPQEKLPTRKPNINKAVLKERLTIASDLYTYLPKNVKLSLLTWLLVLNKYPIYIETDITFTIFGFVLFIMFKE
eukprot:TRINITY_DN14167_c0_g1_i2.p1 TRINITY_DN14167_c0_g1~~TRINITY_DN14167_c0_g1_i2.p1  ORF type:complete len:315 (+),score=76.90 TRINITY_DN14167_c0_g1_i2:1-945(+)